jgi:hypothetical protein
VALFPEFVSTLSDLIFCWLIHCAFPSTACPGGLVGGERERLCRPQIWVRPDKPIRASYACSQKKNSPGAAATERVLVWLKLRGDRASLIMLPVKYSVPSCFRSRLRHRLKLMSGSVPGV